MPETGGLAAVATLRPSYIGARLPRLEDQRLLAGQGRYLADIEVPGCLELTLVRSPFAHARIARIDVSAAEGAPGVVMAVTAVDLDDVRPVPDFSEYARPVRAFPLCRERVRFAGAAIAAVVAADRYLAEDAAELVQVEYEELPVVSSVEAALAEGATRLYEEWPDNKMIDAPGSDPEVERIFASADRVIGGVYTTQRYAAAPMETRGTIAQFADGRLTVWTTTQWPHICRTILSHVLPLAERDIRVIAPDIGGGFGCKAEIYPEDYVVCWAAMRLGRPVRYVEDRAEHLVASAQARDMAITLQAAVHEDGRIEAIRGSVVQDLGSEEIYPPAFNMAFVAAGSLTGPYRIPHQDVGVIGVVTNKTPAGAYRGFGLPEGVFAMERLVDRIARELGLDPLEVRRRNMIGQEDLPYVTAAGAVIDSGSHREAFEEVIEMAEVARAAAMASHDPGGTTRVGVGIANYVEGVAPSYFVTTGNFTANESCSVRFEPDGGVRVSSSVLTMGQGVDTMVATLTAEVLGVPIEDIRVQLGDTDVAPYGLGAWGSRSVVSFGGSLLKAGGQVREKARAIAGHLLETAPEDVVIDGGVLHVAGSPERAVSWRDVATAAYLRVFELPRGMEPGLEAMATWEPDIDDVPGEDGRMNACAAYTNASHAALVEVDVETGVVRVLEYFVTHDCGTLINPMIVEGQIHGGVAQGVGGTLYEHCIYGPEGQPMATTFMDYLVPTAVEVPSINIEHFESPSPLVAFGAKGAGESGLTGPAAAIAAAVEDALREFDVTGLDATPLTPATVLRAIQGAPTG
jgi:carbon-monoxide dehydrogenase large subunit